MIASCCASSSSVRSSKFMFVLMFSVRCSLGCWYSAIVAASFEASAGSPSWIARSIIICITVKPDGMSLITPSERYFNICTVSFIFSRASLLDLRFSMLLPDIIFMCSLSHLGLRFASDDSVIAIFGFFVRFSGFTVPSTYLT